MSAEHSESETIARTMNENQTTSTKEIAVAVRGPSGAETVQVQKLPLNRMADLAQSFIDFRAEAALYVGRPQQWADKLDDVSVLDLCQAGRELNGRTLARWFEFQRQTPPELQAVFTAALNLLN